MISIRRLGPDEAALVQRLRLASIEDSPRAFCSPLERELARSPEQWTKMTETALVASKDGDDIGLSFVVDLEDEPEAAEICGMWVAPTTRGCGAARRLLEASATWAVERGKQRLRLWVADDQKQARRRYEKSGYAYTGERKPFPRDASRTIVEMLLILS